MDLDLKKKFVIMDGNALIFRGYFAIPPLHTKEGELVNAVLGFTGLLINMLQKIRPDYLAVAFDLKGPTFRHEAYGDYKATRPEIAEDLIPQISRIRDVVKAFQIPIFEQQGFEADDLIATVSEEIKKNPDIELLVVSSDMDLTQLIRNQVKMLSPLTGFNDIKIYDEAAVVEKYGIRPDQIVDYKALVGDVSDNIMGVKGIGKKTAATLLQKYETLDEIYAHLSEMPTGLQTKLREGHESAHQSKHLVKLIHNVPIELDLEACKTHAVDQQKIRHLFEQLNFRKLLDRFEKLQTEWGQEKQASLF